MSQPANNVPGMRETDAILLDGADLQTHMMIGTAAGVTGHHEPDGKLLAGSFQTLDLADEEYDLIERPEVEEISAKQLKRLQAQVNKYESYLSIAVAKQQQLHDANQKLQGMKTTLDKSCRQLGETLRMWKESYAVLEARNFHLDGMCFRLESEKQGLEQQLNRAEREKIESSISHNDTLRQWKDSFTTLEAQKFALIARCGLRESENQDLKRQLDQADKEKKKCLKNASSVLDGGATQTWKESYAASQVQQSALIYACGQLQRENGEPSGNLHLGGAEQCLNKAECMSVANTLKELKNSYAALIEEKRLLEQKYATLNRYAGERGRDFALAEKETKEYLKNAHSLLYGISRQLWTDSHAVLKSRKVAADQRCAQLEREKQELQQRLDQAEKDKKECMEKAMFATSFPDTTAQSCPKCSREQRTLAPDALLKKQGLRLPICPHAFREAVEMKAGVPAWPKLSRELPTVEAWVWEMARRCDKYFLIKYVCLPSIAALFAATYFEHEILVFLMLTLSLIALAVINNM